MTDDITRAELAQLRTRVAQLETRQRPRSRLRQLRRFLPLAVVGLLVALMPLSLLAANPFTDLDPAQNGPTGHNPNIDAIFNAGITKGCNPPTNDNYCPKDVVTREQMASFLARTAGLGANPPVANAKTAQNADNATQLGGQPASAYLPATGDLTARYSFYGITSNSAFLEFSRVNGLTVTVSVSGVTTGSRARVPLDRLTGAFGKNLAIVSAQICYRVTAGAQINSTELLFGDRGQATSIVLDETDRASTTAACYTVNPASPATFSGALYLEMEMAFTATSPTIDLDSITLTLRPTTAGAAETPAEAPRPVRGDDPR